MAKKLSKETEEKIASIFGDLNEKLAELARNKIMEVFKVGFATLDEVKKKVSDLNEFSTENTKKMRAAYQNTADMLTTSPAREKAPSSPSTTPRGPGDSSTPGLT